MSINYTKYRNNKNNNVTKVLSFYGKTAFAFADYLYRDSTIYLNRKYKRYLEYCRLYQK